MRAPSLRRVALCLTVACISAAGRLDAQRVPAGWQERAPRGADSARVFEVGALPAGQFVIVRESPLLAVSSSTLTQWARTVALGEAAPAGAQWASGSITDVSQSPQLAVVSRTFSTSAGTEGAALFAAVSGDAKLGRVLQLTFSPASLVAGPHGAAAKQLMLDLALRESAAARSGVVRTPRPVTSGVSVVTAVAPSDDASMNPNGHVPSSTAASAAGVRLDQIETAYYHWDQRYDAFQGMVMDEDVYLLLKDGTVYDQLPPSLEQMDVAALRRTEPQNWGRWRRSGATLEFLWPRDAGRWSAERGNTVAPSRAGTRLEGRFTSASTYQFPGGSVSMRFFKELQLFSDGRFVLDGDTAGTYHIEGYSIELRQTGGQPTRVPFLIDGDGVIMGRGRMIRAKGTAPRR